MEKTIIGSKDGINSNNHTVWTGIIEFIHPNRQTLDGTIKARFGVYSGQNGTLSCGLLGENAERFHAVAETGDYIRVEGELFKERYVKDGEEKLNWFLKGEYAEINKEE